MDGHTDVQTKDKDRSQKLILSSKIGVSRTLGRTTIRVCLQWVKTVELIHK